MINLAQGHKSVSSGIVQFLKSILARFVLRVDDPDEAAAALAKEVARKAKEAARSKERRDAKKQRKGDCSQPQIPTADSSKTPEISASALAALPAKARLSLLRNLSLKERESGRTQLPHDWGPDDATHKFAIEHLGDEAAVEHCFTKFRVHHETSGEERTARGWQSRARGWVLKEKQLFGRQLNLRLLAPLPKAKPPPDRRFYARVESPQLDAWEQHSKRNGGRGYARDRDGGWWFPSEWPPDHDETRRAS